MIDFNRNVFALLGLPLDAVTQREAAQRVELARLTGQRCFLSTPNLNFLVNAQNDEAFRASVCRSDLSVADGMPLVWLARLLGLPLRERVTGSGLFEQLRTRGSAGWNVFFFGGPQGAGEQACLALNGSPGGMRAVGCANPGFGSVEQMSDDALIARVNASGANFVVVSLGSGKGQAWISRNLARLKAPVVSHLGAVINFAAGTVQRAPRWMQVSGLEWLWRAKEEPRLLRRYASDGLALMRLLLTRVLPLVLLQRLRPPAPAELQRAHVSQVQGGAPGCANLHGAWQGSNLRPLRQMATELYRQGGDVQLDLSDTTSVDSAFAGLMLLLDTALRDRGERLRLRRASPAVARLLRLNGLPTSVLA